MSSPTAGGHPDIRIADDGELAELREILREGGIAFHELQEDDSGSFDLLISNPRRALGGERSGQGISPQVHIVVARSLSRTMRERLRHSSCDFIVEDALHPAALRLLVEYAAYRGPERRGGNRVLVGSEVKLKVGWRQRSATLLQLSERGCGLALSESLQGSNAVLRLPLGRDGERTIEIALRLLEEHEAVPGQVVASFAFERIDREKRQAIAGVMKREAAEVGRLLSRPPPSDVPRATPRATVAAKATASPKRPAPPKPAAADALPDSDRRRDERTRYVRRFLATHRGETRVVIGRDISLGGMRISREPSISLGDDLKLVLYGAGNQEPAIVRARVVRDDSGEGYGLQFAPLAGEMRERLGKLVDSVLILGQGAGNASARPSVIVSEVLSQDTGEEEQA